MHAGKDVLIAAAHLVELQLRGRGQLSAGRRVGCQEEDGGCQPRHRQHLRQLAISDDIIIWLPNLDHLTDEKFCIVHVVVG